MADVLHQFHILAHEYLECALRGESHGFSNVSDTLAELYQGVNKFPSLRRRPRLNGRRTFG